MRFFNAELPGKVLDVSLLPLIQDEKIQAAILTSYEGLARISHFQVEAIRLERSKIITAIQSVHFRGNNYYRGSRVVCRWYKETVESILGIELIDSRPDLSGYTGTRL